MARKADAARRCVFCGARGMSNEHVLPEWIEGIAPHSGKTTWKWRNDGIPDGRRDSPLYSEKVRVVCERECNNGWMSRLEDAAKPILTPLIQGRAAILSPRDQAIIATWAAKTALMACFLRPNLKVPEDYARRFYATKRPPTVTTVWIAKYAMTGLERARPESYRRQPMRFDWHTVEPLIGVPPRPVVPEHANGYAVTINVCYFAFKVLVFEPPPGPVRLNLDFDVPIPGAQVIWPSIGQTVRWPLTPALDDIGMGALGSAPISLELAA